MAEEDFEKDWVGSEDEEEDYQQFLATLWADPLSVAEDDEEDALYTPPAASPQGDQDDSSDDDMCDEELVKVQRSEVRELVNGCLETIVGEDTKRSKDHMATKTDGGQRLKSSRALFHYVQQIFKTGSSSEVTIEGLPLNTIRKVVARQVSMAIQLLLQTLLLSNATEIEDKCFSNMMEISNLRDSILKKTYVLRMTFKNLSEYQKSLQLSQEEDDHSIPITHTSTKAKDYGQRITRSYRTDDRSYSIFDVPCLSTGFSFFFSEVERLRAEYKSMVEKDPSTRFAALKFKMREMLSKLKMHTWECLFPDINYPLKDDVTRSIDPSSILGRMQFTPAEDDLLLRGVILIGLSNYPSWSFCNVMLKGEDEWQRIKTELLPSKDEHMMSHRFNEMTASSATNAFKR